MLTFSYICLTPAYIHTRYFSVVELPVKCRFMTFYPVVPKNKDILRERLWAIKIGNSLRATKITEQPVKLSGLKKYSLFSSSLPHPVTPASGSFSAAVPLTPGPDRPGPATAEVQPQPWPLLRGAEHRPAPAVTAECLRTLLNVPSGADCPGCRNAALKDDDPHPEGQQQGRGRPPCGRWVPAARQRVHNIRHLASPSVPRLTLWAGWCRTPA